MLDDLSTAFTLLTRLPVGRFIRASAAPDLARGVWAFPMVGAGVGALGGIVYWLAYWLGLPPFLAAGWTLAATLLVTGAFHEDGLADTADGFGGGRTRERKLEIMRDSRIGSYGALVLGLSLLLRIGAVAALGRPALVIGTLIAAGTLSRAAIILIMLLIKPARPDGMAATMAEIPRWSAISGLALAAVIPLLCLPVQAVGIMIVAALAATLVVARVARSQIGGHTGDVLGACAVFVECVALTAAVPMVTI